MNAQKTAGHTPGPWYFGQMAGWVGVCITRRPVAEYSAQGVVGDAPIAQIIEKARHWETSYPVEANARLIAAAPDLLAALQAMLKDAECFAEHLRNVSAVEASRAAIAKATGAA